MGVGGHKGCRGGSSVVGVPGDAVDIEPDDAVGAHWVEGIGDLVRQRREVNSAEAAVGVVPQLDTADAELVGRRDELTLADPGQVAIEPCSVEVCA